MPFSDPSRPGKIEVELLSGAITVRGENRRDVAIVMRQRPEKPSVQAPAPPGLRRLQQVAGFEVSEERNEIKIEGSSFRRSGALELRVPQRVNLELNTVNDGTITVENVEGEIEIENVNGPVVLTNVAGSVVANSVNGGVTAKLTRVMADKAMAFTSLNGPVDVTLPPTIKANLKLRSDQGEIFTDFDVQLRPAPAGTATGHAQQRPVSRRGEPGDLRRRQWRRARDRTAHLQRPGVSAEGAVTVAAGAPRLNQVAQPGR